MKDPATVARLQALGLNAYEAKAYVALLERNTLTATQVANLAGIPRARVYEILQTLTARGLCVLRPGRFKTYGATNPAVLKETLLPGAQGKIETELQTVKKEERKLILKKKELTSGVDSLMDDLRPVFEKGSSDHSSLDYIEIIKDPYQIHKRFLQLMGEVREELLGFTKPPYTVPRERLEDQGDQERHLIKKGIRLRSIYEIPADENERRWLFESADSAVRHGAEVRVSKELPMKMAILDSRIVIFTLEDPVSKQPSLTSQIVEHRALAGSLKVLFQTLWDRAEDYHILES
jgi:sugar-specific transcriptional regulator TrmB